MSSIARQANFLIPEDVLEDLRRLVPRGEQSQVVTHALRAELKRRHLLSTLSKSFGVWGSRQLMGSTKSYVRKLRKERKIS